MITFSPCNYDIKKDCECKNCNELKTQIKENNLINEKSSSNDIFIPYKNESGVDCACQRCIQLEIQIKEKDNIIKKLENEVKDLKLHFFFARQSTKRRHYLKSQKASKKSELHQEKEIKEFRQELNKICSENKFSLSYSKDNRMRYSFKSETLDAHGQTIYARISFSFEFKVIKFKHRLGEIVKLIKRKVDQYHTNMPTLASNPSIKIVYLDDKFYIKP